MISEEYYVATREKMRGTCFSLIAGFIIGAFVGYLLILMNSDPSTKEKILYIFFFGLVFSGAPYVWKNFSYVSLSIKGIIIQGLVSVLAGWLVTPIMLLVHFVQMKLYEIGYARKTKEKAEKIYSLVFAIINPLLFIIWVVFGILTQNKFFDLNDSSSLILISFEIVLVLTSIFWILYRSCQLTTFIDKIMDIFVMCFLRNYMIIFLMIVMYEVLKISNAYVVLFFEFLIYIDSILFVIGFVVSRLKKKAVADDNSIN